MATTAVQLVFKSEIQKVKIRQSPDYRSMACFLVSGWGDACCTFFFYTYKYLPHPQFLWRQTGVRKLHCRNLNVAVEWLAFLLRIYEFQVRISARMSIILTDLKLFTSTTKKRCCAILQNRRRPYLHRFKAITHSISLVHNPNSWDSLHNQTTVNSERIP
jgi:hypothetical protein